MKKTVLWCLLTAGLVAGSVAQAQESATIKKIQETGAITISYRDSSIPFSFLDDKQKPVGYSMDICLAIAEQIKADLKLEKLEVKLSPVTSATRIPLLQNGTVDLECGSTTNNLERQQQVSFAPTTYVTGTRWVSKAANNYTSLEALKGKTVASTSGTSNLKWLTQLNAEKNLGLNIVPAKDHAEGFLMVQSGRAAAFFMDDILLYGFVANSGKPSDYYVNDKQLTVEPYATMIRKDDPEFKKLVDAATVKIMSSGELAKMYTKWFEQPIPPRGVNLNVPMSDALKHVIQHPTDSGDPKAYE